VTGSGIFNLNSSTIIGAADGSVVLDASNLLGNLTLSIDNTINAVKTITSGSGDDSIEVDAVLSTGTGITVNSGDGYDTITLTSNSDGNNSILSINGGVGGDKIKFATGLDFSLSSMQLTAIESLEFTGGSNSTKLPSNVVSGQNFSIIENGTGTLTLEIFPTQQILNLSTLVFDSSIASGTDKIIVNGSNFSNALTITGSIMDDEITGTHTSNDTISSGDGNDTIDGSDGNDTLTPGNGSDHITPGLGNDTIDLTEVVGAVDTLYFSIDDGATNVDIVTNFDVRVANDLISLDVSELSNPISFGNGSAATAAAAGTITIVEQSLNTNLNHSSNAAASIIKLNPTDKSTFATALGTSEITVANNATINFLWFDNTNKQAVFGYVNENSASPDENLIKAEDTFTEIVRLTITESTYTHFLDNDNFIFI
jgi:Ca2+-binding RTX toxin-like protein